MKRRGFTLIELLVIMAIIMLLVSILVPGIQAAIRVSLRVKCKANLKVIGQGLAAYLNDYGSFPARSSSVLRPNEWDPGFCNAFLKKYSTDPRAYYCPDNSHGMKPPASSWPDDPNSWSRTKREMSYAFLDGWPGRADVTDPGEGDATNAWLCKWYHRGSGDATEQDRLKPCRPLWGDPWRSQNMPMIVDLVLEKTNAAWVSNHGTGAGDPLGVNVLNADGSTEWIVPEDPIPNIDDAKCRWRRIWKMSNTEYLRMVWAPKAIELYYKR